MRRGIRSAGTARLLLLGIGTVFMLASMLAAAIAGRLIAP